MGPLAGMRIVDLTTVVMGPYATQILADFGAEVIKVEPLKGDLVRQIGPMRSPGMGPYFLNANRSKRSVAVDLKTDEGRQIVLDLCKDADALVYNIRPAAMGRLGLSYEDVCKANPTIVYAGTFGYGQTGPYAARPAYDDLIQGGACLPYLFSISGSDEPRYVPSAVADRVVGLTAIGGILAALLGKARTGEGQRVDVPMLESMASFVLSDHLGGLTFEPPLDKGGYQRQLAKDRRPYKTSDGYICALIYTDAHWRRFLTATGRGELMDNDPRYSTFSGRMQNLDAVYGELSDIMLTRTSQEWYELFEEIDVPVMWMHDLESVLEDEHLKAVGFFRHMSHPTEGEIISLANPVQFFGTPVEYNEAAPRLGQHTVETLHALKQSPEQIAEMIRDGVVLAADAPVKP
ncbi:CaiB/BaiF CoA transferase family protein [Sulfitobacter sp. 1A12126]|uniref:CaiB/BaiF CoA transferase family protein n=1 Tax=Sulfitobacter sp. 1A12126 TaxID=3368591 RepID=UPI003745E842